MFKPRRPRDSVCLLARAELNLEKREWVAHSSSSAGTFFSLFPRAMWVRAQESKKFGALLRERESVRGLLGKFVPRFAARNCVKARTGEGISEYV